MEKSARKKSLFSERLLAFRGLMLNSFLFVSAGLWFFWEPDYVKTQLDLLDTVFDLGAVIFIVLCLVFLLISANGRKSLLPFYAILAAMGVVMILSTLLHSGVSRELWKCLKYIYPITGAVLLLGMAYMENEQNAILSLYWVCWIQTVINCFTVFLFQRGLYRGVDKEPQYFLGNENLFIMTILPGLCAGYLLLLKKGKKISWDYAVMLIAGVGSILKVWSVSSLIGVMIFIMGVILIEIVPFDWLFSIRTGMVVTAVGFFSIVVFRLHYLLEPLIVGVLHKDITLTERTILWSRLLEAIRRAPLLGYGVETAEAFNARVNGNMHWVHAHDYYLELLMKGGVVLLACFILLLIVTDAGLYRARSEKRAKVYGVTIGAFLICFIGDCYEMRTTFYMILTMAFAYGCLQEPDTVQSGTPSR